MSTNFEDLILRDIAANRPAAGIPGRLFFDTTNNKLQRDNGSTWDDIAEPTAGGDVSGPVSSTDNAVARWDGTGGDTLQNSGVTIDDNGTVNIPSGQTYNINGSAHGHAETEISFSDVTTGNATTGQHGYLPKLGGGTSNFLRADGSWAAPAGTAQVFQAVFSKEGTLTTGTGTLRIYNNTGASKTVSKVMAAVNTAPTGASIIVDVNINGTTCFTTQSNRPTITATNFTASQTTIENATLADGAYLTMDVDQVGSTIAGADLTVHIVYS